jgi:site-specific DNA-methyltransferase (adenine-specific)
LARVSKRQIIWGGNFMLDNLGAASCMIVWDKKRRGMDQADCEIAWTNIPGQSRIFDYKWNGMLQENMKDKEQRIHPTQKPVMLYSWLLSKYAKPGDKILDTHVGSASSLIACHRAGLEYWGFEIDPVYYKAAKERLDRETAQVNIMDILR